MESVDTTLILALKKGAALENIIEGIGCPKHLEYGLFKLDKFRLYKVPDKTTERLYEHEWVIKGNWMKKVENYDYINALIYKNKIKLKDLIDDYFIIIQDLIFYEYYKPEYLKEFEAYFEMVNKIETSGKDELKFIFYKDSLGSCNVKINKEFQ